MNGYKQPMRISEEILQKMQEFLTACGVDYARFDLQKTLFAGHKGKHELTLTLYLQEQGYFMGTQSNAE